MMDRGIIFSFEVLNGEYVVTNVWWDDEVPFTSDEAPQQSDYKTADIRVDPISGSVP